MFTLTEKNKYVKHFHLLTKMKQVLTNSIEFRFTILDCEDLNNMLLFKHLYQPIYVYMIIFSLVKVD